MASGSISSPTRRERNARSPQRLGLEALDRLEAHAALSREGETCRAEGRLAASLEQSCVVTGEPVAAHVDEPFDLVFMPEPQDRRRTKRSSSASTDCDVVFHDGAAIDLGSAIADTLALSLDPYPRSAGAEAALREAGVLTEARGEPLRRLWRS